MVFRWPVRILFIDTDASGRIHYTALLRYFEAAEIELFREAGAQEDRDEVAFPRVHVECDYRPRSTSTMSSSSSSALEIWGGLRSNCCIAR